MKGFAIFAIVGSVFFVAMGMQLGLFGNHRSSSDEVAQAEPDTNGEKKVEKKKSRARFPQDLAPAAQAKPVDIAAAFEAGDRPHKMVFMKPTGIAHAWQENHGDYREDWCAASVEETELVVVVGAARELKVSYHTYPNGAPPITRYQYEVEASVVEAKTGRVLANRRFVNMPRALRSRESWETTHIGAPVNYQTVFRWAAGIARVGPPSQPDFTPIINVIN